MSLPFRPAAALMVVVLLALAAVPVAAQGVSQAELYVARELPRYEPDVDVATLSTGQIAALYLILTEDESPSHTRLEVRSVIYGIGNLLRGGQRQFP